MKNVICLIILLTAISTGAANGANLIYNGDFELGNTGFNTDYNYVTSGTIIDTTGRYSITTDPCLLHPFMADFHDHTSGSGNMLVANGSQVANAAIWIQTVSVLPNTN